MSKKIWTILGVILAVWVAFMALGWIFSLVHTFIIVALVAVCVVVLVSLVAGRSRRS